MKTIIKLIALYLVLFFLFALVVTSVSPPYFSKTIKFTIKLPPEVEPLPLRVAYRSYRCRTGFLSASDGKWHFDREYTKDIGPILFKEDKPGYFSWDIRLNVGRICGWKLDTFTVKFQYKDEYLSEEKISDTSLSEVEFDFAEELSKASNKTEKVQRFSNHFFPVLTDWTREGGKSLAIRNFSKGTFYITEQKDILYIVKMHSNMLVRRIQPEEEDTGRNFTIIYPDGSTQDKEAIDYKKLFKMLPQFEQQP